MHCSTDTRVRHMGTETMPHSGLQPSRAMTQKRTMDHEFGSALATATSGTAPHAATCTALEHLRLVLNTAASLQGHYPPPLAQTSALWASHWKG